MRRLLCAFATVAATLVAGGIAHADPKSLYDMGVLNLCAKPSGAATGILSNPTRDLEPLPFSLERSGVGGDVLRSSGKGRDENGGTMLLSFNNVPEPESEPYALMIAGLGLIGTIVVRRQRTKANEFP